MQTHRYKALDGWRGICALIVAIYHYPRVFAALEWPIFSAGWIFVDYFFVLSGFVITHRYFQQGRELNLRRFIAARMWRLYPMHALTLTAVMVLAFLLAGLRYGMTGTARIDGVGGNLGEFARLVGLHLILLQGFLPFSDVGFNVPSWSISVELWTNLAFALLARVGGFTLISLMLVTLACTGVLAAQPPDIYLEGNAIVNFARSLQGFALGGLAYGLLRLPKMLAWTQRLMFQTVVEILALGLVALAVLLARDLTMLWSVPFLFAVCVMVFASSKGAATNVLHSPALQRVGELSYAIYLVHFIWVGLFYSIGVAVSRLPSSTAFMESLGSSVTGPASFLLYLIAVWASAAWLTDLVNKRWFLRRKELPLSEGKV